MMGNMRGGGRKREVCILWVAVWIFAVNCAALKDRLDPPTPVETGMLFRYEDPAAWRVEVAGQFNDWKIFPDQKAIQMAKGSDGIWTAIVPYRQFSKDNQVYVEPGKRYQYKIVINGTSWKEDPNNPQKATEGGITNTQITVPVPK